MIILRWYCDMLYCRLTTDIIFIIYGCVRLASLGRPRCVAVFFPGRTWVITHVRPGEKKNTHTGVYPGKLIERKRFQGNRYLKRYSSILLLLIEVIFI